MVIRCCASRRSSRRRSRIVRSTRVLKPCPTRSRRIKRSCSRFINYLQCIRQQIQRKKCLSFECASPVLNLAQVYRIYSGTWMSRPLDWQREAKQAERVSSSGDQRSSLTPVLSVRMCRWSWAPSQAWIPTGKRSGLQTRIHGGGMRFVVRG